MKKPNFIFTERIVTYGDGVSDDSLFEMVYRLEEPHLFWKHFADSNKLKFLTDFHTNETVDLLLELTLSELKIGYNADNEEDVDTGTFYLASLAFTDNDGVVWKFHYAPDEELIVEDNLKLDNTDFVPFQTIADYETLDEYLDEFFIELGVLATD